MNFLDAMKAIEVDHNLWARPVAWKGLRYAYTATVHGHPKGVPGPRGAHDAVMPAFAALFAEWETVWPRDVVDGR